MVVALVCGAIMRATTNYGKCMEREIFFRPSRGAEPLAQDSPTRSQRIVMPVGAREIRHGPAALSGTRGLPGRRSTDNSLDRH